MVSALVRARRGSGSSRPSSKRIMKSIQRFRSWLIVPSGLLREVARDAVMLGRPRATSSRSSSGISRVSRVSRARSET